MKCPKKMGKVQRAATKILNYIDWLDEYYDYENEASSRRVVSTKFIRDDL